MSKTTALPKKEIKEIMDKLDEDNLKDQELLLS
jgi:hypothetical protein